MYDEAKWEQLRDRLVDPASADITRVGRRRRTPWRALPLAATLVVASGVIAIAAVPPVRDGFSKVVREVSHFLGSDVPGPVEVPAIDWDQGGEGRPHDMGPGGRNDAVPSEDGQYPGSSGSPGSGGQEGSGSGEQSDGEGQDESDGDATDGDDGVGGDSDPDGDGQDIDPGDDIDPDDGSGDEPDTDDDEGSSGDDIVTEEGHAAPDPGGDDLS